ncbi:MAG: lactaldehyde reductase [Tissierellia bacterium]|nr:lactaldehyde reductase [Tissierellia bacterium]
MDYRIILNPTSYHGYGALNNLVPEIKKQGFKKGIIFSDKVLFEVKTVEKVSKILDENDIDYALFTDIKPNPTITNVKDGLKKLNEENCDFIIAIGGGSVMDTAKAVGIVKNNPEFEDIRSLEGVADTKNKALPMIAIPTTAGTAAEITINYVITDEEKKKKMVCVDPNDIPYVSIVDPVMMESMPKSLAASTGMDALTHAIEGYITKGANDMTDMFELKAIEMIAKYLPKAVNKDKEAIEKMALAQYIAGMGFSNCGLGLVHSMAHPLGALYSTPHGVANAILLADVMEYNKDYTGEKYRDIARAMGVKATEDMSEDEYRQACLKAVKDLANEVGIELSLKDIVKEEDLEFLADSAMADACLPGNPRDVKKEDVISIYKNLM